MARVFTITFTYLDEDRSAMINVRPTPFYTEYVISMFDEELAHELYSNTIVSSPSQQFKYLDCLEVSELMQHILDAVTHHLRQSNHAFLTDRK